MNNDYRILKFYARKDVQTEIVSLAKNREIAVKFADKGYGKRPDILQYESDVKELAQEGATSFHLSEEHWHDPLKLKTGMTRKDLDELRSGRDLILDIDCKFIEFSKIAAQLLIDALHFHNINSIGLKFSGNRGFHLAVPFGSFPEIVDGRKIHLMFPEGPRMIAEYLSSLIKEHLSSAILSISTPREIMQATQIPESKLMISDKFDPFAVVDVDTILISSRHLFRSPYSINEKSGMVSIVVQPDKIKQFRPSQAKIENVEKICQFLPAPEKQFEAQQLLIQAFDHAKRNAIIIEQKEEKQKQNIQQRQAFAPQTKVSEEFFPPCIKLLLKGVQTDGRKRAILVLINFLKHMKYEIDEIEQMLLDWNKKNYEPLREGYIRSQVSWHRRNSQIMLPPNCANESYYPSMGICKPDNYCTKIKNPTNYSLLRLRIQNENKKPIRQKKSQPPKNNPKIRLKASSP